MSYKASELTHKGLTIADPIGRAVDTGVKLYSAIEGTRQAGIANDRAERELKMREEAYATQREMAQMELDKKRREFKDEAERRQFDEDFQYFSDAFVVGVDNPEEARARLQKFTPDRKERLQQYFPGMGHLFANAPKVGSAAARLRDQVLEIGSAFDEGKPVEGMEVVRRNDGSMLLKGSKVRSLLDTYAEIDEGRFSKIPLKKGTEPEYSMVARPDGTMAVQVTYTKADGSVVQEAPMTRGRTAAGDEGADDDIVSLFTPRQAFDWATSRQVLAQKAMEWQALHGDKDAKKALADVRSKGLSRQEEGRRSQEIGELLKGVVVTWDAKDPHGSAFKYMQALRETGALGEAEILAETTRMLNAKTPKDKKYQIVTVGTGNGMEQTVAVNTADPADRVAMGKPTAKWKAGDGGGAGGDATSAKIREIEYLIKNGMPREDAARRVYGETKTGMQVDASARRTIINGLQKDIKQMSDQLLMTRKEDRAAVVQQIQQKQAQLDSLMGDGEQAAPEQFTATDAAFLDANRSAIAGGMQQPQQPAQPKGRLIGRHKQTGKDVYLLPNGQKVIY